MPTRHHINIQPARGGRKYVFVCSCGVRGWETDSSYRSHQLGEQHKAKATR